MPSTINLPTYEQVNGIKQSIDNMEVNIEASGDAVVGENGKRYKPRMRDVYFINKEETLQGKLQEKFDELNIETNAYEIKGFMKLTSDNEDLFIGITPKTITIFNGSTMEILQHYTLPDGFIAFSYLNTCRFFYDSRFFFVAIRATDNSTNANSNSYNFKFAVFDKHTYEYKTTTSYASIGINIGTAVITQLTGMTKDNTTHFSYSMPSSSTYWPVLQVINGEDGLPVRFSQVGTVSVQTSAHVTITSIPSFEAEKLIILERASSSGWVVIRELEVTFSNNTYSFPVRKLMQIQTGNLAYPGGNTVPIHCKTVNGEKWYFIMTGAFVLIYNSVTGIGGNMLGPSANTLIDTKNMRVHIKDPGLYRKSERTIVKMSSYYPDINDIYQDSQTSYVRPVLKEIKDILFDRDSINFTVDGWNNEPTISESWAMGDDIYLYSYYDSKHYKLERTSIIDSYKEMI